jgi:hypothetical protein
MVPELLAGEHLLRSDELLITSMEQLARDRAIISSLPPSQFHLIMQTKHLKVSTNEKVVAFYRSAIKLFSLRFSSKSVHTNITIIMN